MAEQPLGAPEKSPRGAAPLDPAGAWDRQRLVDVKTVEAGEGLVSVFTGWPASAEVATVPSCRSKWK